MTQAVSYLIIAKDKFSRVGKKINKSINKIDQRMSRLGNTFKRAGAKMAAVGKSLALRLSLPIVALGGFLLKAASDAEETASKFTVVFSKINKNAEASAANLKKNFGLSSQAAKTFLSDTGDLLTGFGFSQKKALELSESVAKLGIDLASFTNVQGGAKTAITALTKALLGERESIKLLGISILEEDVKRKVQLLRAKGMRFETMRQAKAFATLKLAQEQSKNAIGDFARTSQQLANQMRILKGDAQDLAVSFGKLLIPLATKITKKLVTLAKATTIWVESNPKIAKFILLFGSILALIGPLVIAFGAITFAIGAILPALAAVFSATGAIVAAIVAALAGISFAIFKIIESWDKLKKLFNEKIDIGIDFLIKQFDALTIVLKKIENFTLGIFDSIAKITSGDIFNFSKNVFDKVIDLATTEVDVGKLLGFDTKELNKKPTESNFNGVLDINVKDKGNNLGPLSLSNSGGLDVGLSRVGI